MKKRIISFVLVLCMVLALLPAAFMPVSAAITLSGSGTVDDPYLLTILINSETL